MEPELDNWCIVELVYLASHGDKAVAVLNLLNILLSGCLCGYFAQHCLGECKPHMERGRKEWEVWGFKVWRVWEEGNVMDGKGGGGGVGRDAEEGWIGGWVFGMEEEELNNREKGEGGRGLNYGLQHCFNIIIKEASTSNAIIPKCEMCVWGGVWVKAGRLVTEYYADMDTHGLCLRQQLGGKKETRYWQEEDRKKER